MNSPSSRVQQRVKTPVLPKKKDEIDEVGVLNQKKVVSTFSGDEVLQFSLDLIKINEYGGQDERQMVITSRRILLMNQFTIRRKVSLKMLIGITLSLRSHEFILHFSNDYDDDDLRLYSDRRKKIVEVLVKVVSIENKCQIPSYQINDPLLKKYQNFKEDRKKGKSKIPLHQTPTVFLPRKQKFLFYQPEKERQEAILDRERARSSQTKQTDKGENLRYSRHEDLLCALDDFSVERIIALGSLCQVFMVLKKQGEVTHSYCMKSIQKFQVLSDPAEKEQVDVSEFVNNLHSYVINPFLVPLEYAFESQDTYYFITEFMKAGDLCNLLTEQGSFSEHRVQFYVVQIILALEHLHQRNLSYKDLKLENILMDQHGFIYLTDFGRARSNQQPVYGSFRTPEYIAPECLSEPNKYELYSDFWQLGIIIYEMIYSHTPFTSDSDEEIYDFIQNCHLVFPDQPQISPYCQDFIVQLLQKDPHRRLGYKGGIARIQDHSWLSEVDWKMSYDKKIKPIYRPPQEAQQRAQKDIMNAMEEQQERKLTESAHTRSSQQLQIF